MKKEFLQEQLKNLGVELDAEKAGAVIASIQAENGKDIENAKTNAVKPYADYEDIKGALAKYQEGGELFIDKTEFDRLKQFEIDTKTAQTKDAQFKALKALLSDKELKLNADTVELLIEAGKVKGEFDANNVVTNADAIKAMFADGGALARFKATEVVGGGNPATPPANGGKVETDPFIQGFKNK